MSRKPPTDIDTISNKELTELLADAEMTTSGAIERDVEKLKIASPEDALVVDE